MVGIDAQDEVGAQPIAVERAYRGRHSYGRRATDVVADVGVVAVAVEEAVPCAPTRLAFLACPRAETDRRQQGPKYDFSLRRLCSYISYL